MQQCEKTIPKNSDIAVSGKIVRILLRQENSRQAVLLIDPGQEGDYFVLIGDVDNAVEGMLAEAVGSESPHPRYGRKITASEIRTFKALTKEALTKLLVRSNIPGVGEGTAKKLIDAFGADHVIRIIESKPEQLSQVKGVGEKKAKAIIDAWKAQDIDKEALVALQRMGIPYGTAYRIVKYFKGASVSIATQSPYRLCIEVPGVGFKTADQIALGNGVSKDDPARIEAGIHHILDQATSIGDCGISLFSLVTKSALLLEAPQSTCKQSIENALLLTGPDRWIELHDGFVFPEKLVRAEEKIANALADLIKGKVPWSIKAQEALSEAEKELGVKLAEQQRAAVLMALSNKVSILTGGPGTGKTTVLHTILHILKKHGARIVLAAPTGKAAKRANETTGMPASTIHRLLGKQGDDDADALVETDSGVFDEFSMVDVPLTADLLSSLTPDAAILIVGDVDQLASVGPGQVLSDLIQSQRIPTTRLTEVFRQAAGSLIIQNAHLINQGKMPRQGAPADDFFFLSAEDGCEQTPEAIGANAAKIIVDLVTTRLPAKYGFNPLSDIQVLSPMNKGGAGVIEMNRLLQQALNPLPAVFVERSGQRYGVGDKIIQTRNNYELDVFNGDIGFISDIDKDRRTMKILFDSKLVSIGFDLLDDIKLAYTMTIHKSQGSEAPAVIIPVVKQHYVMLLRNLLYTGVTRGKSLVVLVGQKDAIRVAVENDSSKRRISRLKQLLMDLIPA